MTNNCTLYRVEALPSPAGFKAVPSLAAFRLASVPHSPYAFPEIQIFPRSTNFGIVNPLVPRFAAQRMRAVELSVIMSRLSNVSSACERFSVYRLYIDTIYTISIVRQRLKKLLLVLVRVVLRIVLLRFVLFCIFVIIKKPLRSGR